MKIKEGFLVKKIAGDYLVVPTGDNIVDFAVAVSLNETGAFLWEQLKEDKTLEELAESLVLQYEIDKSTAEIDALDYVNLLKSHDFIEE